MYILRVRDLKTETVEEFKFESVRLAEIYKNYHLEFGNWKGRANWIKESDVTPEEVPFICNEKTEVENKKVVRYYYVAIGLKIDCEIASISRTLAEAYSNFRDRRNEYLKATDWSQLADAAITSEDRKEYRAYRTYLRDLPKLHSDNTIAGAKVYSFEEWKDGNR